MNDDVIEIWKDVSGYEGLYQVSNLGKVRSLPLVKTFSDGSVHYLRGVILKQSNTTTGYKKVELSKNGFKKSIKVHRLVAQAFLVNTYNKPHINNKDGNPINNVVDNLEWVTQKENVQHAYDNGLRKCKKNSLDHNKIIKDYLNHNVSYVTKNYNIPRHMVYAVLKEHKIKPHGGVRYNVTKDEIQSEILKGVSNKEIADKYGCSRDLVATRKYQMKKEGLLRTQ